MVNVVDLMRLFPARYHPHGSTEEQFVELFTVEKRASDALSSVKVAATETREQLQSRIDQAQVDMDLAKKSRRV